MSKVLLCRDTGNHSLPCLSFLTDADCSFSLPSEDVPVKVVDEIDRHRYGIVEMSFRTLSVCVPSFLTNLNCSVGLVFAFMAFFVYEQYESEIDGVVDILFTSLKDFMIYLMRISPVFISRLLHYRDNFQQYERPRKVKNMR